MWYFPSIDTLHQVAAEEVDEGDLTAAEIARKNESETRDKGAKRKAAESLSNFQTTIGPKSGQPESCPTSQRAELYGDFLFFLQQEKNQT